jgi:hypothetical protein
MFASYCISHLNAQPASFSFHEIARVSSFVCMHVLRIPVAKQHHFGCATGLIPRFGPIHISSRHWFKQFIALPRPQCLRDVCLRPTKRKLIVHHHTSTLTYIGLQTNFSYHSPPSRMDTHSTQLHPTQHRTSSPTRLDACTLPPPNPTPSIHPTPRHPPQNVLRPPHNLPHLHLAPHRLVPALLARKSLRPRPLGLPPPHAAPLQTRRPVRGVRVSRAGEGEP